jgi:hypothetical protein
MDRHYRKGMTLDEAKDVLRKCILEVCCRHQPAYVSGNLSPLLGANTLHCQPAGVQGPLRGQGWCA